MKFATKLTATVIVLSTITVPVLGASIFYLTRNIIQQNITADQVRQTQEILNNIDRTLYNAYQDIELISKDSHLESLLNSIYESGKIADDSGDQHQFSDDFENIIRLTGPWDLINIIANDGTIAYSSRSSIQGMDIRQFPEDSSAHFAALTGRRYYSDLTNSALVARPGVIFSAAIKDRQTSTTLGTVVGHYAWPIILQILDRTHSSKQIRLFNRDGTVIATTTVLRDEILITNLNRHPLVRQMFTGKRITNGITHNDNSGPVLSTAIVQAGYLGYRGNDWGLLLGVPTQIAFTPVFQLARNITIIIVVILTLIIVIIYLFAKRLARPIETLKNAAAAIGAGDYDYPIKIESGDEIQDLGDSFVEMAQNRKQAETEIRSIQAELQRQEHLATLGQLTATVNHELRNPLAAIRTALYMLHKTVDAENHDQAATSLDLMDRNIDRCDHIIDQMLDFTRVQSIDREDVLLDEWLLAVMEEQSIPEAVTVEFKMNLPGRIVSLNPDGFRRAVINLVDNACKAMAENAGQSDVTQTAKLKISTRAIDDRIEVEVADNGPGIPEDVLPHIFEPLYSTRGFGVGLGLPTVRQLLEQHGGDVKVETVVGKGTSMLLWFPINKAIEAIE